MPRIRRARKNTGSLEARMVLHGFMCARFGCKNLRGVSDQLDESRGSSFAQAILMRLQPNAPVSRDALIRYDENIGAISDALGMTGDRGRTWKPFRYPALLFTGRYPDLYFQDREILVEALNRRKKEKRFPDVPDYTAGDIHTPAFQSATGSGKTLLLHANILRYRRYLKEYKLQPNRIGDAGRGASWDGRTQIQKTPQTTGQNGFTFEYSATFNQAMAGSGEGIKELRDEYGKQILFDYSYKFFHADGYGKGYKIQPAAKR